MAAGGEGVVREFEMDHVPAAVFKIENHQGPAVSTWDPARCQVAARTGAGGGVRGRMDACVCRAVSLLFT